MIDLPADDHQAEADHTAGSFQASRGDVFQLIRHGMRWGFPPSCPSPP